MCQISENSEQSLSLEDLRGNWLGAIEVAPGTIIRQVIQILDRADGNLGANFASIDQGVLSAPDVSVELAGRQLTLWAGTMGIRIQGEVAQGLSAIVATISQGSARVPAIVFVSGSGPTQRSYSTSVAIADYFAQQGFAVLRYDKRGVFQSTGLYGRADEAAFARDAASAWSYLRSRGDIETSKIGFIGHSEGSQVSAQAVADYGADAAFLISMAGVGLTALETTIVQDGAIPAAAGATADEVQILQEFSRRFYAIAMADGETERSRLEKLRSSYEELEGPERDVVLQWNGPYGLNTGTLNPRRASGDLFAASMRLGAPTSFWRRINAPVLVLNGGLDSQVPAAAHVPEIMSALRHPQSTSIVFPEKNHMFQNAITGSVDEYDDIEDLISSDVLHAMREWLEETM